LPLRDYQDTCWDRIEAAKARNVRRMLIAMATGTGKGNLFAEQAKRTRPKQRMMMLVHTVDLVEQGAKRIRAWNPGVEVGIEMAERFAGNEQVVVASVQTLGREGSQRLQAFDPETFDWLSIDEAHHGTSESYRRVISHFGLMDDDIPDSNPTFLTGWSATSNRADGTPMGEVFDEIVYQYSIQEAIRDGWLVDIKGIRVKTTVDISKVGTKDGELNEKELEEVVNTPERNKLIADAWIQNCYPRKSVVFCVNIQHARDMALAFQMKGIPAEAVWGDDPLRKNKIEKFENGELQVLINVKVLTEGVDIWSISCVVLAAPSKSQGKVVQEVGRGVRLQDGMWNLVEARANGTLKPTDKQDMLVMDVSDVTGKHSLVTLPSLFGLGTKLDLNGTSVMSAVKALEEAQLAHPNADFSKLDDIKKLKSFVESINLFQVTFCPEVTENSELQWHRLVDQSYRLLLPGKESVAIKGNLLGSYIVSGKVMGERVREKEFENLPAAFAYAESYVFDKNKSLLTLLRRESRWHKDPMTIAQLAQLKKFNVPEIIYNKWNKGDAAKYITKKIGGQR